MTPRLDHEQRWADVQPDARLTRGVYCDGTGTVDALKRYNAFGPEQHLLEIGPGYGRTMCEAVSAVQYVCCDIRDLHTEECFDVAFSFLCFKHIHPDFSKMIQAIDRLLKPSGMLLFDVIEGDRHPVFGVNESGRWFGRYYTRRDILSLMPGWTLSFDTVRHRAGYDRLLVAAVKDRRKPIE